MYLSINKQFQIKSNPCNIIHPSIMFSGTLLWHQILLACHDKQNFFTHFPWLFSIVPELNKIHVTQLNFKNTEFLNGEDFFLHDHHGHMPWSSILKMGKSWMNMTTKLKKGNTLDIAVFIQWLLLFSDNGRDKTTTLNILQFYPTAILSCLFLPASS